MSQSSREAAEACTTALGDGEGEQAEGAEGTVPLLRSPSGQLANT